VIEFDSPQVLLDNPNSMFSSMVEETGSSNAAYLRRLAKLGTKAYASTSDVNLLDSSTMSDNAPSSTPVNLTISDNAPLPAVVNPTTVSDNAPSSTSTDPTVSNDHPPTHTTNMSNGNNTEN